MGHGTNKINGIFIQAGRLNICIIIGEEINGLPNGGGHLLSRRRHFPRTDLIGLLVSDLKYTEFSVCQLLVSLVDCSFLYLPI